VFALADANRSPLAECPDGRLTELVKNGDSEAFAELTARYIPLVRARVLPFHSRGAETDDLCQEGLLGLLSAARAYDPSNGASFRTYAGVCISNRVIMAYRSAAGRKNDPLSHSVSLSEDGAADFLAQDSASDPEALVAERDSFETMCRRIEFLLTPLELRVLRLYLGGGSYGDIAKTLSVTTKAADNALQRVRFKLKHRLNE
jgi:RNA polymerase sporulation-specific sigma factor